LTQSGILHSDLHKVEGFTGDAAVLRAPPKRDPRRQA